MKVVKRLISIFFYAISIFLLLFIIFEIFMPNKTIDYLGIKTYVVLTPSMEPDINVNDMIVVKKTSEENIEVGDVISFTVYIRDLGREAVVTHYVGDIIDNGGNLIYKTRGASAELDVYDVWLDQQNEEIDITYDDIVGEMLVRLPYIGHLAKIVKSPVMIGLVVLNIGIIYALIKVIKYKPKKN